ncbi:SPOR domain-containing protein [Thioclava sp. GXIMD4216]|uniref:SPOR domain-containing protein n=1 Tax=Thioclava sp. GXIMD4216 TaxID=3131929 RepID=UPI0030CD3992
MRMGRWLTSTLILAVLGTTGAAFAQDGAPSELPPASFKGRQYVDSQGCVFVRGGFGNAVRWVPRVNRDRTPVCNYKPTFGGSEKVLDIAKSVPEAPSAPAAPVAPVPPKASVVAAAPKPSPKADALAGYSDGNALHRALTGAPMRTIALTTTPPKIGLSAAKVQTIPTAGAVRTAPVAMPVAPVAPSTAVAAQGYVSPYMVEGAAAAVTIASTEILSGQATNCPNRPAQATRYRLSDGRSVLRCGAPAQDPAAFINTANIGNLTIRPAASTGGYQSPYVAGGVAPAPVSVAGNGRARVNHNVTRLPAAMPVAAPVTVSPQQAYAASSPYAIPREVYVKTPNAPVSLAPVAIATSNSNGYAPAFDDGRLNPFRGPRSRSGDAQMQQLWDDSVPAKLIRYPVSGAAVPAQTVQVSVSSKSPSAQASAPASSRAVAPSGRFVQVGTYAEASNAEAAKARLRARGLPVAASRTAKGLVVVYAGPFDRAALAGALGTARRAGFADAYIR